MSQVKTVNVIEYASGTVQQIFSFVEGTGNAKAEEMFIHLASGNGMDKTDTDDCLNDGLYEQGDYQVFLVHSN
jgi:hypothetical protein